MAEAVRAERASHARRRFEEFTGVTLARTVTELGVTFPAGTKGVVVHAYENGLDYEVEFRAPAEMVLTLSADDLR